MSQTRLQKIEAEMGEYRDEAAGIIGGNDNYDRLDGARNVLQVCNFCRELIAMLKEKAI